MTQPFSCNLQYHAKSFFFPSLCSLRFNNINRKNVISFFPLKSLNNFSPLPHLTGSHLSWRSVKLLPYKSFYIPVRAQYQSMFYMKWTFWLEELFFKATLPTQTWSIWWKCLIAFLNTLQIIYQGKVSLVYKVDL